MTAIAKYGAVPLSVESALVAVVDALGESVVMPNVRLAARAHAAQLNDDQRLTFAAALFELADAITRATT